VDARRVLAGKTTVRAQLTKLLVLEPALTRTCDRRRGEGELANAHGSFVGGIVTA